MKPINNEETFGRRVRHRRKEKKMSQSELADQMKTTNKMISRYERDEMKPSIEVALKLAKHLQTSVGFLLGEQDLMFENLRRELAKVNSKKIDKVMSSIASIIEVSKEV